MGEEGERELGLEAFCIQEDFINKVSRRRCGAFSWRV